VAVGIGGNTNDGVIPDALRDLGEIRNILGYVSDRGSVEFVLVREGCYLVACVM